MTSSTRLVPIGVMLCCGAGCVINTPIPVAPTAAPLVISLGDGPCSPMPREAPGLPVEGPEMLPPIRRPQAPLPTQGKPSGRLDWDDPEKEISVPPLTPAIPDSIPTHPARRVPRAN